MKNYINSAEIMNLNIYVIFHMNFKYIFPPVLQIPLHYFSTSNKKQIPKMIKTNI